MSKVYKCELLSINEDINVESDRSRRHNIANANTAPVATVLVQKTMRDNYFKEILTGILIPVYRVERYRDFDDSPVVITEEVPKYGCFIKYTARTRYERYLDDDLVVATADEVEEYIRNNRKEDMTYRITSYMKNAEMYYNSAKEKDKKSDDYRVRKLLKTLRK